MNQILIYQVSIHFLPAVPNLQHMKRNEAMTRDMNVYREIIKENIGYEYLLDDFPDNHDRLEEILELIVETVCSTKKYIRVAGSDYPAEVVRSRLLKLDMEHIKFEFDCLKENTTKIRNIKKYLLTTLYNALNTGDIAKVCVRPCQPATQKMSYKTDYKIEGFFEYVVPPLEGFWWQDDVEGVDYTNKSAFNWISVIRLPDFVAKENFDLAAETATKKKKLDCSSAEYLTIDEGLCVQIMHFGSLIMSQQVLLYWKQILLFR